MSKTLQKAQEMLEELDHVLCADPSAEGERVKLYALVGIGELLTRINANLMKVAKRIEQGTPVEKQEPEVPIPPMKGRHFSAGQD